ncbi:ABC transporter substrate-binding protein [Atopobium sp. oral taxon 199]|uniref:ABC transporter substrate-binding protein n=1 Tax=Atopobium sp. oral taxon 199 TaxID=712156 RepID=UPI00034EA2B8|nr:ABC transporter substrate-binding protein [Atopobium sp. oral taxon 199]EPD77801.1 peptide/nickel transport system substrate-binding protein [Atopobium sp. oral taxon 199 str. F0494]
MLDNSVSRREFLKASAMTAAGGGASMMLAACGGGEGEKSGGSDKKKILRFGSTNSKQGLDMQRANNSQSAAVADSICEGLLRWTEENELVPCLAKTVPSFEPDGITLNVELKSGVKFHDGTELKATDVKYTFERMFRPETGALSTSFFSGIKGAQEMLAGTATELEGLSIKDDTHLTFTLTAPNMAFISVLGISYACIYPEAACEAAGKNWGTGTNLVGTGKYRLAENDDTTAVKLTRFDDYHDGAPALDEIRITYYDDDNTKLLAYKNGDLDWCDLPAALFKQYSGDADLKDQITSYPTLGVNFINLNLKEDNGLTDVRVRQALSYAINRQELVDTFANGNGIACSGWLPQQIPGFDVNAPVFAYDVDKAKALLAEAGVSDLKLTGKVRKSSEKLLIAVQDYWQKAGVTLDVQVEDNAVWNQDWANGNLQITTLGWYALFADGSQHLDTYFSSKNAVKKSSFYNNADFDKYLEDARKETDKDKRAEDYKAADNLLTRTEYATLPLFWPKNSFVAKSYVKGAKVGNLIYHFFDLDIDTSDAEYKVPED